MVDLYNHKITKYVGTYIYLLFISKEKEKNRLKIKKNHYVCYYTILL